jgi:hypothetical protein
MHAAPPDPSKCITLQNALAALGQVPLFFKMAGSVHFRIGPWSGCKTHWSQWASEGEHQRSFNC